MLAQLKKNQSNKTATEEVRKHPIELSLNVLRREDQEPQCLYITHKQASSCHWTQWPLIHRWTDDQQARRMPRNLAVTP